MPKKVTEIFTNLFSNKSCSSRAEKLVTDAAPLDDQYERTLSGHLSDDKTKTPVAGATAASPLASTDRRIDLQASHNAVSTSSASTVRLADDDKSLEPHEMPGLDIALSDLRATTAQPPALPQCVNNTQGYNVYQFSQVSGLHIGSVYNISQQQQQQQLNQQIRDRSPEILTSAELPSTPFRKTKTIDAMMHSGEQLAHRHMDIVSTHLGEGWRDIIRLLGFSDGQIEQLYEDNYARGIKEVIYGFLLDYQRNDAQASVGHLTRLLWKAGRRECVYILKEYWKGTQRADASASNAFDSQQTNPTSSKLNDESVS